MFNVPSGAGLTFTLDVNEDGLFSFAGPNIAVPAGFAYMIVTTQMLFELFLGGAGGAIVTHSAGPRLYLSQTTWPGTSDSQSTNICTGIAFAGETLNIQNQVFDSGLGAHNFNLSFSSVQIVAYQ